MHFQRIVESIIIYCVKNFSFIMNSNSEVTFLKFQRNVVIGVKCYFNGSKPMLQETLKVPNSSTRGLSSA